MKQIFEVGDTVDILQTWFGSIDEKPRFVGTAMITEINSRFIVLDNGERYHRGGRGRSLPRRNNCLELRRVNESGKYFYLRDGDKIRDGDEQQIRREWLPVPTIRIGQYYNDVMPRMRRTRSD